MPALVRGEVSDCSNPKLDVFVKDQGGLPINVSELSFQIFDKVTNPGTPVQIYPTSGRQSVDLTACPVGNRLETGRYVAVYSVPLTVAIGTHEIRWYTKLSSGSPEQTFAEEFEILSESTLLSDQYYVSVSEVRALGINTDPPDDAQIQSSICLWQQVIERVTRQWFRPIELEMYLDGTDSDTLHFPVPIISIEEIRINDETSALDTEMYRVYNGVILPDDRKNPRIKLIDYWGYKRDIYTAQDRTSRKRFYKGRQNQYVKGVFGYVEADGSVPKLIKRALLKLVVNDLGKPIVDTGICLVPPPITTGNVQEEWIDGHKIKYQISGGELKPRAPGLAGLIDDPEVQRIITLYKAPIGMATPANWSYT